MDQFDYSAGIKSGGLGGIEIPVVGLADPDYQYRLISIIHPNGSIAFKSGFDFEILLLLQDALNFTHKAINGEGWVDRLENGSWTGMGRQVEVGDAILSISQSSMLPDRSKAFDFLMSTVHGTLVAAFRQPPSNSFRNIITSVFPPHVWISWIGIGISAFLSVEIIQKIKGTLSFSLIQADSLMIQDYGLCILGSFCQKGWHTSPESISIRIIYLSLLVSTILAYVAFSGALMAHLAVEILPITSFNDLLRSDIPLFGDISIPFTSLVEKYQEAKGQRGSSSHKFMDVRTGVRKVMDEDGSFVTFPDTLYTAFQDLQLTDHFICDHIYYSKVTGSETQGAMFLGKGSPYRNKFSVGIAKLLERGYMARLHEGTRHVIYPRCPPRNRKSSSPSLRFADLYTAFLILTIAFLLSALLLATEIGLAIHRNSRNT